MDKNARNWTIVGVIVLVIIAGWLIVQQSHKQENFVPTTGSNSQTEQNQNQDQSGNGNINSATSTPSMAVQPSEGSSTWEGTLEGSNNLSKGNLMLVMPDHTIYINTTRDYSSLIGKPVIVTYQGSLDSFGLVDITGK